MPAHPPRMRRGEHFLGRNIGIACDAVSGAGGATYPFMALGEPDREIRAWSGVMQRTESLPIQPFGPAAQRGVVLLPCCNGIVAVHARGSEDRVRELSHRD